jgi:hypothetical protein
LTNRRWPSTVPSANDGRLPAVGALLRILIQIAAVPERKAALRAALRAAASGQPGGPWSISLRPALLYRTPGEGIWWWCLTLTSPVSRSHSLLLAPEEQTPEGLAEAARKALGGERFTVVCASCGRVRIDADSWIRRERVKSQARPSHGLCPECLQALYPPELLQRARSRSKPRPTTS